MKICVVGSGLRTPLLVHGIANSGLDIAHVALYDVSASRAEMMNRFCAEIVRNTPTAISAAPDLDAALRGAAFVISSIRVGDLAARAGDERISVECGCAGQETTGPAGFSMALRTLPAALRLAQAVERVAPEAWIINFTNPAGLITQALTTLTDAKTVGICDTPGELIHRAAEALGEPDSDVVCDYFGLNHLGWIRGISVRGQDLFERLLCDDQMLGRLYPADLFDPLLIRALGLIPTEYLFYYYSRNRALANQLNAAVTRGEELLQLNRMVLARLHHDVETGDWSAALAGYREYLNRRNSSYMRLEGAGESAFAQPDLDWDPFAGATGYHRIAVDTIAALTGIRSRRLILNVPNRGSIPGLKADDVVEVPCDVDYGGPRPPASGSLPESVESLVLSVKHYERLTIRAFRERSLSLATLALMSNPLVGSWDVAERYIARVSKNDESIFEGFS